MSKSDIRFAQADNRMRKVSYRNLNPDEKKYIKAREKYQQFDKSLAHFWRTCKRTESGQADFQNMTEDELDYFDYIYKECEKARKQMESLAEKIDVDFALNKFLQTNIHSYSF